MDEKTPNFFLRDFLQHHPGSFEVKNCTAASQASKQTCDIGVHSSQSSGLIAIKSDPQFQQSPW